MAAINEIVLVHVDNKPGFYARIEDISPDVKPGWWQVRLLVLTFPLQVFTWILDESQVSGAPYTMGGTPVCLEKVVSPVGSPAPQQEATEKVRFQGRFLRKLASLRLQSTVKNPTLCTGEGVPPGSGRFLLRPIEDFGGSEALLSGAAL